LDHRAGRAHARGPAPRRGRPLVLLDDSGAVRADGGADRGLVRPAHGAQIAPQTKSATSEPRARNGPNGKPNFLPARPRRARMTTEGTSEATLAITRAAATLVPRAAPIRKASLTSPIPIPCGEIRLKTSRKPAAPAADIAHTGLGSTTVMPAR